jgi:hypothetical protein
MHFIDNNRSRISYLNLTLLPKWCVLNRLSNPNFDAELKKNTLYVKNSKISVLDFYDVPTRFFAVDCT